MRIKAKIPRHLQSSVQCLLPPTAVPNEKSKHPLHMYNVHDLYENMAGLGRIFDLLKLVTIDQ